MREGLGLSLRDLAHVSGTSAAYLSQVERGVRVPSDRWLQSVTKAIGEYPLREAAS